MITETIQKDAEFDVRMTGDEEYPVIGTLETHTRLHFLLHEEMYAVKSSFKGLPRYAACLEKNMLVQQTFGGVLVLGAMRVMSAKNNGMYGFDYNPPHEFHAWVQFGNGIVFDFALPGVIERGMKGRDHVGPFIEGRRPALLAGVPPTWLLYMPQRIWGETCQR